MSDDNTPHRSRITPEEALAYHLEPRPGKYDIVASTPMATQRDLSLAYSPGVAVPVQAIADAHGGRVYCIPGSAGGSRFVIELPRQ